jgi:hypothetical protein
MTRDETAASIVHPIAWVFVVGAWLLAANQIASAGWEHGKTTWAWMLVCIAMLAFLQRIARRFRGVPGGEASLSSVAAVVFLALVAFQASGYLDVADDAHAASDVGLNVAAAEDAFVHGENPYSVRTQLWHPIVPGPHATVSEGKTRLYGVPYHYGFPYLPGMFLSYLPFRALETGVLGVRRGIAFFTAANVGLIVWLTTLLTRRRAGLLPGLLGAIAYLGLRAAPFESFALAVTDVAICAYALAAFVAWQRGAPLASGLLFGVAQGCKFLPGPLLVLPLLLSLRPGAPRRRLALGYVASTLALTLPWFAANPWTFVSSTVLFYLNVHGEGDKTAAWFFLPKAAQVALSVVELVGTAALVVVARRAPKDDERDVLWPMTLSFSAFLYFTGTARMSHLNYVWGVYGLGCAALAAHLCRGAELERRGVAERATGSTQEKASPLAPQNVARLEGGPATPE